MRPGTIVFAILVLSTVVLAPVSARALPIDNTRWCAVYGGRSGGGTNCGFFTWQQCMAMVSGIGGFCEPINSTIQGQPHAPANGKRTNLL